MQPREKVLSPAFLRHFLIERSRGEWPTYRGGRPVRAAPPRDRAGNPAGPLPALPSPWHSPRAHPLHCPGPAGSSHHRCWLHPSAGWWGWAGGQQLCAAQERSVLAASNGCPLHCAPQPSPNPAWIPRSCVNPHATRPSHVGSLVPAPWGESSPSRPPGWTRPSSGAQPVPVLPALSTAQPESARSHQPPQCPATHDTGGPPGRPRMPTDGTGQAHGP